MTPRQIELIEASFAHVVADADQAANLFYHRLFTIAPDVKPLLKTPVEERGHKLAHKLAVLIARLDNMELMMAQARPMAERFAGYGIKPGHYASIVAAFMYTLKKGLGDKLDPEGEAAWEAFLTTVSAGMVQFQKTAAKPSCCCA